jgi:hypothetical protein
MCCCCFEKASILLARLTLLISGQEGTYRCQRAPWNSKFHDSATAPKLSQLANLSPPKSTVLFVNNVLIEPKPGRWPAIYVLNNWRVGAGVLHQFHNVWQSTCRYNHEDYKRGFHP